MHSDVNLTLANRTRPCAASVAPDEGAESGTEADIGKTA